MRIYVVRSELLLFRYLHAKEVSPRNFIKRVVGTPYYSRRELLTFSFKRHVTVRKHYRRFLMVSHRNNREGKGGGATITWTGPFLCNSPRRGNYVVVVYVVVVYNGSFTCVNWGSSRATDS